MDLPRRPASLDYDQRPAEGRRLSALARAIEIGLIVSVMAVVAIVTIGSLRPSHPTESEVTEWLRRLPPSADETAIDALFASHGISRYADVTDKENRLIHGQIDKHDDIIQIYVLMNAHGRMTEFEVKRSRRGS